MWTIDTLSYIAIRSMIRPVPNAAGVASVGNFEILIDEFQKQDACFELQ
jgi:hypothetical protein